MCELFAMSSSHPVNVKIALNEFALHGGISGPHKDGWGIAYYDEGDITLIREANSAGNSDWMEFIRDHDIRSTLMLSHIRAATKGGLHLKNTHPFHRELAGRMHTFIHNGTLVDIEKHPGLQLGAYRPIGDTDSEYAFCILLDWMQSLWLHSKTIPSIPARFEVVSRFARTIDTLGNANFIYADGQTMFVHAHRRPLRNGESGPPGLHVLLRGCLPKHPPKVEGLTLARTHHRQSVVLVASVPLTDEDWYPLKEGEILAIEDGILTGFIEFKRYQS